MFSETKVNEGIHWSIEHGHYEALKNYSLANEDHKERKLKCLDEFELYSLPVPCDEDQIDEIVSKNVGFKFDLEREIGTGSCYGLSCYIYELIDRIQRTTQTENK